MDRQRDAAQSRLAHWEDDTVAAHYAQGRFDTERAARRDRRLIEKLWPRDLRDARVLDVPCGTGRLWPMPAKRLLGIDSSLAMLRESRPSAGGWVYRVRADVRALPLPNSSFDVVVCCRLLHHLWEDAVLDAVVGELMRVSRRYVLASFFDRHSLHAMRKRRQVERRATRPGRIARSRAELARCFERAGGEVDRFAHSARFWSQQAFVRVLKRGEGAAL